MLFADWKPKLLVKRSAVVVVVEEEEEEEEEKDGAVLVRCASGFVLAAAKCAWSLMEDSIAPALSVHNESKTWQRNLFMLLLLHVPLRREHGRGNTKMHRNRRKLLPLFHKSRPSNGKARLRRCFLVTCLLLALT